MADTAGAEHEKQAGERLQKYLAHAGIASRRHAEVLIEVGVVSVNGVIVRELGVRVNPASDEVRVRGRLVRPTAKHLYILLNKPLETVTTAHDPQRRRTVLDLLPAEWVAQRVYPVGRLDVDTEGLLLLTNDGELALRLTHPRFALTKEYEALVANRPSAAAMTAITQGMMLPGETRPTAPARAWIVDDASDDGMDGIWLGVRAARGAKTPGAADAGGGRGARATTATDTRRAAHPGIAGARRVTAADRARTDYAAQSGGGA